MCFGPCVTILQCGGRNQAEPEQCSPRSYTWYARLLQRTINCFPLVINAGLDCPLTTVKVDGHQLRIDLHSPLPDGAVTDMGAALNARGTLKREPQGVKE
jgi:hypothetical protein